MPTYLVGGAVRDQLLGREVTERDWVVTGTTPQQMLDKNFVQVGKGFPVFLHPKTKEEYALARIERKQGTGYQGFVCDSSVHVTLEQDLLRRDLTVNAMALSEQDELIDPYGGQTDLENKILRHVSPAFAEDPLRVFRVARFAARYHHLGFNIASDTLMLMRQLVQEDELSALSAERVWKETSRSLMENNPEVFFETLKACDGLRVWFIELDKLWGIPNPATWHPEIDTGVHTMMVLKQAVMLSNKLSVRFAALVHDLGKALTPADNWPAHHGHEKLGLSAINALCDRVKVPNDCRELALMVSEFHSHVHRVNSIKASTLLKVLNQCDAWRKPERFEDFLLTCEADARGRKHFEHQDYPQADVFRQALAKANEISVQDIVKSGKKGAAIREELDRQRIEAIKPLLAQR